MRPETIGGEPGGAPRGGDVKIKRRMLEQQ